MISYAYVNGFHEPLQLSNPFLELESYIDTINNEIDSACEAYIEEYNDMVFNATMNDEVFVEKKDSNIFETIGNAIIKVVKKIKEFMDDFINKLKGFEKKSDFEKLQLAAKGKDPEVVKGLYDAFNSGNITVYDAKSIKDIEDAYLEFLKHANNKDIDPKTLSGKFEIFKKKCENADKNGIVSIAKAVTATTAGVMAIPLIRKTLADIKKSHLDCSEKMVKNGQAEADAIMKMSNSTDQKIRDAVDPKNGAAVIRKNAFMFYTNQYEKIISHNDTAYSKVMGVVKSLVGKIDKKGKLGAKLDNIDSKVAEKNLKSGQTLLQGAQTLTDTLNPPVDRKAERKKARENAADNAYGTEKGRAKYYKNHKQEIDKKEADKARSNAYAQQEGRNNFNRVHENELLSKKYDDAYDTAYAQAAGKRQFENDHPRPQRQRPNNNNTK